MSITGHQSCQTAATAWKMVEVAMPTHLHIKPSRLTRSINPFFSISISAVSLRNKTRQTKTATAIHAKRTCKISAFSASTSSASGSLGGQLLAKDETFGNSKEKRISKKRLFFLDVNPLCYAGATPSLHSFGHWISLFFSQVSLTDPVIAVSSCIEFILTWMHSVLFLLFAVVKYS